MTERFRKVLLVIIDGLRPDAITPASMPVLSRLGAAGWAAGTACTIRPSVTVAALTSLATGVSPARHGVDHPSLTRLGRIGGLAPLPIELRRAGVATSIFAPVLGGAPRWMAGALLRLGGVTRLAGGASAPAAVLRQAAEHTASAAGRHCVVAYVNDTDIAGHAWGWMSTPYLEAAGAVDQGLPALAPLLADPECLVLVTADHGGGGVLSHDHDHPHPVNDRIPLYLLGEAVAGPAISAEPASLLDIPATVLWALGVPIPEQYEGRVLHEAFVREAIPA